MDRNKGKFVKGYTRVLSAEHKRKLSESHKGKKQSPEHLAKRLAAMKGKTGNKKGFKHTQETKDKISKNSARFFLGKKLSDEHNKKCHQNQVYFSGEKSRRWIKDRTQLKISRKHSYDTLYREWSSNVKKRDNWKCRITDKNCSGRLESHHILSWRDYPELRYDINNGITLCHKHHPRKHEDEEKLSPCFKELISS